MLLFSGDVEETAGSSGGKGEAETRLFAAVLLSRLRQVRPSLSRQFDKSKQGNTRQKTLPFL